MQGLRKILRALAIVLLPVVGTVILYGSASGEETPSTFERALIDCGSTAWSDAAVPIVDRSTMCDGVDRSSGYLICRMVQVLITDTMRHTKLD